MELLLLKEVVMVQSSEPLHLPLSQYKLPAAVPPWRLCAVLVQLLSQVWLFATPWTVACQAPLSMGLKERFLHQPITPATSVA